MNKLMRAALMSAVMVILMCSAVFAQVDFVPQGSALIPDIQLRYHSDYVTYKPYIHLTNITNQTIRVKVKLFDHAGVDISHYGAYLTGTATGYAAVDVRGTAILELPAYSSRIFDSFNGFKTKINTMGHGVIEWSASDPQLKKALVATCQHHGLSGAKSFYSYFSDRYLINNGQPF